MTESLTMSLPALKDAEAFAARSSQFGMTPGWFREMQERAWEQFQSLPMPTRMNENWRFANLRRLASYEEYRTSPLEQPEADDIVERSHRLESVSGRLIFVDENLAAARFVDPEVEKKGVIFTTLVDAIARHPELVQETFMRHSPELGSEKFEHLHLAMLRSGVFLYVPDNVEIEKPFVVYNWTRRDQTAIFPHTLFVTGKNAKATLIDFQEHADPEASSFIVANAHVIAKDGSKPHHYIVQNWSPKSLSFQLNTASADNDVSGESIIINTGSQQARQEVHGRVFGKGTNIDMHSLNVTTGDQEVDQRTLQTHIGPNSRSDLLFKNALLDDSRTIFSGLIVVEKDAQQTDAYQTNNNLLLSPRVEANSLPGLEINANDVKCSHGATSGQIDDSNMFYFLARGIPRRKAEELIVFGFFEEIISKFDNEELSEYVRGLVRHKFVD